jgi:outer membrane protein with beta-barrel domain
MRLRIFCLSLLAVLLFASLPARADWEWVWVPRPNPYDRKHFYMGGGGVGVAVLGQTGPHGFLDPGGGFDLFAGVRVHRSVALEFAWQPTFHNNETDIFGRPIDMVGLEALTADVKVYPLHRRVQPYFIGGGGAYLLGDSLHVFATGPGFQVGGGLDVWLNRYITLGGKVQYRGVELLDYDRYGDNTYLSLLTVGGDVAGHF